MMFSNSPEGHNEVDVDFAAYSRLQSQNIDFTDAFAQADIPSGETILIDLPREFQE